MTDPRQRRQLQQLNTIAHQAARLTGLLGEAYIAARRTAALAARLVEILALEYGNDDQVLIDLGVDGVLQAMIDAEEPAGVIHIRRDLSDTEAAEIKDRWIAEHGSTANRPAGDA